MGSEVVQTAERLCREVLCPSCRSTVRFTTLHLQSTPTPFMYCDRCSNVLLRKADQAALNQRMAQQGADTAVVQAYYKEMEQAAPQCSCGGHFTLWSNVKCPHCSFEFPYNDGVRDPAVRFYDSMIVVLEGAVVVGGTTAESWRCQCRSS